MPEQRRQLIEMRSALRYPTSFPATLRSTRGDALVEVLDLSGSGARLGGPELPAVGTMVTVEARELSMRATVTWSSGTACGLRFATDIDPLAVVRCNMTIPGRREALPVAVYPWKAATPLATGEGTYRA